MSAVLSWTKYMPLGSYSKMFLVCLFSIFLILYLAWLPSSRSLHFCTCPKYFNFLILTLANRLFSTPALSSIRLFSWLSTELCIYFISISSASICCLSDLFMVQLWQSQVHIGHISVFRDHIFIEKHVGNHLLFVIGSCNTWQTRPTSVCSTSTSFSRPVIFSRPSSSSCYYTANTKWGRWWRLAYNRRFTR